MNPKQTGRQKEEEACKYLAEHGFRIQERNYSCRQGEVDIIGYHQGYLVFVEVKYRKNDRHGSAAEAVTLQKQKKICRTADHYRYLHGYSEECPVRYDVAAIQGKRIVWYPNAFEHRK